MYSFSLNITNVVGQRFNYLFKYLPVIIFFKWRRNTRHSNNHRIGRTKLYREENIERGWIWQCQHVILLTETVTGTAGVGHKI